MAFYVRKPVKWMLKLFSIGIICGLLFKAAQIVNDDSKQFKFDVHGSDKLTTRNIFDSSQNRDVIRIVVVACQGKSEHVIEETVTMIKSALIFTKRPIVFHVFTSDLSLKLRETFIKWPLSVRKKLLIRIHDVQYPLDPKDVDEMINWWGPCASFRLFLPTVLDSIDSVLYVDTDVTFLGAVDDLWEQFANFDEIQVGGLAPRVGWDFQVPKSNPNFIELPNGHVTQVNSGVFLMNLTRMRRPVFRTDPKLSRSTFSWNKDYLLPLYRSHIEDMHGDQNLINTVFHYNPKLLYFISCRFNYHHKFCIDTHAERQCRAAERDGAAVVHGNANTYQNNFAPVFRAIHQAMKEYHFERDSKKILFHNMKNKLTDPKVEKAEHCGNKTDLFLKVFEQML
uniref:UDP-D-xylose:beta-D-glucoside alpha-1,3-D-xylosyltransferase n=1 Tax=Phallusia mammillata TaxID=59560 RepID=A0A6F9DEW1_9ASCI|nr:glucoside xylosyltransferase 1-like [Phallusia mammillata]